MQKITQEEVKEFTVLECRGWKNLDENERKRYVEILAKDRMHSIWRMTASFFESINGVRIPE